MQRHAAFQDLSRDHFDGLLACLHVTRAIEGSATAPPLEEAKARLMTLWNGGLRDHFDEEDEDLRPHLEAPIRERLDRDHARLRAAFDALPGADDAAYAAVAQDLRQHIRWEEDVMFPWLQEHLDEATLQDLWRRSRAFRLEHRGPGSVQEPSLPRR